MPMLIELTCRVCHKPYTPTMDDIRRGAEVYKRCPSCRLPSDDGESGVVVE